MPIKVTMPALSPTMTEGNLARWVKKEGDMVAAGDVIAEIETDKATMEVEAVDEGRLAKILVKEGTEGVAVNTPIAVLLEEGESEADIEKASSPSPQSSPEGEGVKDKAEKTSPSGEVGLPQGKPGEGKREEGRIFASPLAKRIATEAGIDIARLQGSGPHGRIVKADVEKAKETGAGKGMPVAGAGTQRPVAASGPSAREMADMLGMEYEAIPNDNVRKIIANRLLEAKQTIPHFYLTVECRIDDLLKARKRINDDARGEYKVSVNDFIIKAVAQALNVYPKANVAWTHDAILQYKHADISVAVATPNGLITPIIKKAETKGLRSISEEMKDLAARARENKLKPEEFQGGTFSVSNLGMLGIKEFSAIINPPQSCILAVGAGEEKPYVDGGEIKVGTFMHCTLSVDHRSVDGAVGAEFLKVFRQFIENPVGMLV